VAGPKTNVAFLKALAESQDFREGRFVAGAHAGIDPDALARRQGERPQGARRGQEAVIRARSSIR
jgi:3-methylcrotonyl-CoA carboxylase alpha subunit